MAATIQQIVKPTRARGLDTSGNNNHAQIYSGRALEFDGVADYLDTNMTSANAYGNNTNFTVTAWYKCNGNEANYHTIVGNAVGWSAGVWLVVKDNDIRFNINNTTGGDYALHHDVFKTTDDSIKSDTWYRIVATYDSVSGAKIYLNGVEALNSDGMGEPLGDAYHTGNVAIGAVRHDGAGAQYLANASISDVQIWSATWTAADAEYDYLNPEQLALNRGGTSLTNSNLKLWYPMNEGHRGNQSYVLDASNTGICDNIVDSGITAGTTKDGWVDFDTGDTQVTVDSNLNAIKYTYLDSTSGMYAYLRDSFILTKDLVVGNVYKISYKVKVSDSSFNVNFKVQGASITGSPQGGATNSTEFVEQSFNILAVNTTGHYIFGLLTGTVVSGQSTVWLKDFKVEPINDKHNATTVFYGDELVTEGDFSNGGAAWSNSGGTITTAINGGAFVSTGDADGGFGTCQQAETLVAGRTYKLTFDVTAVTGSPSVHNYCDSLTKSLGTASITSFSDTFVSDGTGGIDVRTICSNGQAVTVDNISLKEVGVASGWTDADQQLDIPQTALQSYNQLGWNHNPAPSNHPIGTVAYSPNFGTDNFVVSFSMFPNVAEDARFMFQNETADTSDGRFVFYYENTKELEIYIDSNAAVGYSDITDTILEPGQWHHIIAVFNRSANTITAYVNGVAQSQSVDISSVTGTINGGGQFLPYSFSNINDFQGCLTEIAFWKNTTFSDSDASELYNEGLILDAREHSKSSTLINYWKNNGLADWEDLVGSTNLTNNNMTETMLITAGADSSRDSQGFLMNRQRTTNSLNLTTPLGGHSQNNYGLVPTGSGASPGDNINFIGSAFSFTCWVKLAYGNPDQTTIIFDRGDGTDGFLFKHSTGRLPVFTIEKDNSEKAVNTGTSNSGGLVSGGMTVGTWYFVSGTHEGLTTSADMKIYVGTADVEAVRINTNVNGVALDNSAQDLYLGSRFNKGLPFSGELDDLCFYDKELSQDEVLRNYNAGKRSHR